ncbi:hypothetical protein VNO78_03583 [Psophocarpus tetragonolobus]|uniref:Uncharacterized protein n=1 Tax=Psophocarpus tetragonolobus TaxID=3891 RepID=A0AAN9T2G9_PSOTE
MMWYSLDVQSRASKTKDVEDEKLLPGWILPYEKIERSESTSKRETIGKRSTISYESFDDDDHMHMRNVNIKDAKYLDNKVLSNDIVDCDFDWLQKEALKNKKVEDTKKDAISEDSLDVDSLQLQRMSAKGKHPKCIDEDIIFYDQIESCSQKQ